MGKGDTRNKARTAKNDEFYTLYENIQAELNHYEKHFKGATVLCNCDDPFESNFCKFFLRNFNYLKLKRLICTSYHTSSVIGTQISLFDIIEGNTAEGHGYVLDVSSVPMKNGRGVSDEDIDKLLRSKKAVKELNGNGDFRSQECIDYLKEADIVVTNPPFSLFTPYVQLLFEYNRKFIIMGTVNNTHYKEIFPLFKENKMWVGYSFNKTMRFNMPESYKGTERDSEGRKIGNVPSICWFTNLEIKKRDEELVLYKEYNPDEYPKYDNYDAIEIGKYTKSGVWEGDIRIIPKDYFGIMGVPDSFLDVYNPKQFEIVASSQTGCHPDEMVLKKYSDYKGFNADGTSNGRTGSTCSNNAMLEKNDGKHAYYRNADGHTVQSVYSRIFIRRKDQHNEDHRS